jgi:hypothetical protein
LNEFSEDVLNTEKLFLAHMKYGKIVGNMLGTE